MQYVIGIEGGGTKSRAVALGRDRRIHGRAQGRGMNIQTTPLDSLREILAKLVGARQERLGKPSAISIGLAGCDRIQDKQMLKGILREMFPGIPCLAESDSRVGLYAAFEESPGILLIAGTGSIAVGQNGKGRIVRAGGWGYLLGDEGSGYAIGRKAIRACLEGRKTRMAVRIQRTLKLKEIKDVIPWVYSRKDAPREVARLAPLVFEAARQKDPAALEIVEQAASSLCDLCFDLAEQLNLTHPSAAFSGGLLSHPTPLRRRLRELLGEHVSVVQPRHPAPVGAALLAERVGAGSKKISGKTP
jgi:N-acetylglucosamine kinase-like BadF-type ATPase